MQKPFNDYERFRTEVFSHVAMLRSIFCIVGTPGGKVQCFQLCQTCGQNRDFSFNFDIIGHYKPANEYFFWKFQELVTLPVRSHFGNTHFKKKDGTITRPYFYSTSSTLITNSNYTQILFNFWPSENKLLLLVRNPLLTGIMWGFK